MIRIKNTALDRSKSLLHRTASKLEMEPMINGVRLRLNSHLDVPEAWVKKNQAYLEGYLKAGIIDVKFSETPAPAPQLNADGLKLGGPTLEAFIQAGYTADRYPPAGYAEVPSAGLTAHRKKLELAREEEARGKAMAEAAEISARKAREEAEFAAMLAAEEAAKAEAAKKLEVVETVAPVDTLTVTPAPAPVEAPAEAPTEEVKEHGKKGKKKLF